MSGDLDRDLAEARTAAAADRRRQARRSRRVLEEESTLAALLAECCARELDVVVDTVHGTRHVGRVDRVSDELVVVTTTAVVTSSAPRRGTTTIVDHGAIAALRVSDDVELAAGAEVELGSVTMLELLADLADREADVTIRAGALSVSGRVRSVGQDVAVVKAAGDAAPVYLRVGSVSEISVSSAL